MASQTVEDQMRRARERSAEKERGASVTVGFRTLLARTADILIPSTNRLPVTFDATPLQDADGNFLPLTGYDS